MMKSGEKYFCSTLSSFLAKFCEQKLNLVTSEILGLLLKTLTANFEYYRNNTDNLQLPVQMQLSWKPKIFSLFFIAFFGTALNFEYSEKTINIVA